MMGVQLYQNEQGQWVAVHPVTGQEKVLNADQVSRYVNDKTVALDQASKMSDRQALRRARGQQIAAQDPEYFRDPLGVTPTEYGLPQRTAAVEQGYDLVQSDNPVTSAIARGMSALGVPMGALPEAYSIADLTPVGSAAGVYDAGVALKDVPEALRAGEYGRAAGDVAMAGLLGLDAAATFLPALPATMKIAKNLGNRGPVPTMGSNFGNLGGDGGGLLGRRDVREYSEGARQAKALKQNKGSYDQMRSMLRKAGVTEEELQWTGADNIFKGKTVTKDELEQFFLDRTDATQRMELKGIADLNLDDPYDLARYYTTHNLDNEIAYYTDEVIPDMLDSMGVRPNQHGEWVNEAGEIYPTMEDALQAQTGQRIPEFVYDEVYDNAVNMARDNPDDFIANQLGLDPELRYAGSAEYAKYFPEGGADYTENLYTYRDPNVELLGQGINPVNLKPQGHFGDTFDPIDEQAGLLGWSRTGQYDVSAPASGRAHYVGEIQSDALQKIRDKNKYAKEQGLEPITPRNYDQTMAYQQYYDLPQNNALSEALGYWSAEPLEDRARALSDLVVARYNNEMRAADPNWVDYRAPRVGEAETPEMTRAYDAFYDWTADRGYNRYNFPASTPRAGSPEAQQLFLDLIGENGSTPFPEVNKALAAHRMGDELSATKDALRAAGADDTKFMDALPYGGASTSKWNEFALRRNLYDAIRGGADWLATPYDPSAIAKVGGGAQPKAGAVEAYQNIVSKDLRNLARKYDPQAQIEMIDLAGGATGQMPSYGLRLTPEFIDKVAKKGIPIWSIAGAATPLAGLLYQQEQERQGLLGGGY